MDFKRAATSIVVGLCLSTIVAAAKAYVDVERLKIKVESLFDVVSETRNDVKEVKHYLLKQGRK